MADVVVNFQSNAEDLKRDLQDIDSESKTAGLSLGQMATSAGTLAAAALSAGAAVGAFLQQVADVKNELTDMSARTGIAVDKLAGLKLASAGAGVSLSSMEEVLKRVTAQGLELDDVVATLQDIEDPTERAARAMELMGEQGGRLIQVLGDSSFDAFQEFARTFGTDTGPEATKAAAEWQRAMAEFQTVIEGFMDQAGTPLLEFGTSLLRDFTRGLIFVGEVGAGVFAGLTRFVENFITSLSSATSALVAFASGDLAGAAAALDDFVPIGETLVGVFDDISGGVERAFSKVEAYNRLVAEMSAANGVAAGSGNVLADAVSNINDEVDETIEVFPKVRNTTEDWFRVAEGGVDLLQNLARWQEAMGDAAIKGSKKAERAAKAAFALNKAAGVADVVIKTAQSIMAALTIPPPVGPILAGVNAASGAASLAAVLSTSFEGGGSIPSVGGGSGVSSAQAAASASSTALTGVDANGTRKFGAEDTAMYRRGQMGGGGQVRFNHRILDGLANDKFPGSAFDQESYTGQSRYDL